MSSYMIILYHFSNKEAFIFERDIDFFMLPPLLITFIFINELAGFSDKITSVQPPVNLIINKHIFLLVR